MRSCSCVGICLVLAFTGCASQVRTVRPPAQAPTKALDKEPPVRLEEAVKQFDVMRDKAQFEAAQSYWRQGEAGKAESELKQLLERTPEYRGAKLLLAEVYLTTERPAPARELLTMLVEKDPSNARLHHALGLAAEALGEGPAARAHFQKAVNLAPSNATYAADLANWTAILGR